MSSECSEYHLRILFNTHFSWYQHAQFVTHFSFSSDLLCWSAVARAVAPVGVRPLWFRLQWGKHTWVRSTFHVSVAMARTITITTITYTHPQYLLHRHVEPKSYLLQYFEVLEHSQISQCNGSVIPNTFPMDLIPFKTIYIHQEVKWNADTLCMIWQSPSPGHPSAADEAWYWPKCVLRSGWLCVTSGSFL